jgi:biotin operon repressor
MILQTENPIRMVRELKGAPLSIIIALGLVQQRVSQGWLERSTGYTDKPISQALQYLREVGLVDETRSGWQLVKENAKQLPMVMQMDAVEVSSEDPEETQESESSKNTTKIEETAKNQTDDIALSRNYSDSLLTYLNNKDINKVSKVSNAEIRKNSDLDSVIEENIETFRELGIKINRRTSNLARMKHITREYILATVRQLKQGELLGLAIIRMEQGEEIAPKKKHKSGCGCPECRGKYGEWEE